MRLLVVALGGNAFMSKGEGLEAQWRNVLVAARDVADLVEAGYRVVVTHGNGPQVGAILEWAYSKGVNLPLDEAVAMTQGWLGYLLQHSISRELESRGVRAGVVTVVSRVEVDPGDPAFANPTKPIGPYYTREQAEAIARETNWVFKEDPRGGYRRVVPSPKPVRVIEANAVKSLVEAGYVVVAAGGGGIPVEGRAGDRGVEAVVDKDLASAKLAEALGAEALMILTDVDYVYVNYGKPNQAPIKKADVGHLERLSREGHFPEGSMGPKVRAVIEFLKGRCPGAWAAIGRLGRALEIVRGLTGTIVACE